jgi:acetylornithine deacetylase
MKGAVAAIAYAAAATLEAQMSGEVNVVLSADEEAGSRHGSAWLASEGLLKGDVCVVAEPSGIRSEWEAIRVVSRGVAILTIHVRGTQMHSSLSDELPSVNANVVMARLMVFLHQRRKTIFSCPSHWLAADGPTFNVGLLTKGGLGYGILPGEAEFLCDVRALPGMTRESIERDLRAAIEDFRVEEPELDAHLELLVWTPPAEISQDNPIIRALESASADVLGRVPPLGVFPGGTDAPLFVGAGIPTVPSFGPGCLPRAHAPNEAVPLRSIVEAAHLYAVTAIRYAGLWQDLSDVQ